MTTEQLLELDCRAEENKEKIKKALKKIKPLKKYDVAPLEALEKCLKLLGRKYGITCREISSDIISGEDIIWRSTIFDMYNLNTIRTVYGCTMYEALAKTVIAVFVETRRKE